MTKIISSVSKRQVEFNASSKAKSLSSCELVRSKNVETDCKKLQNVEVQDVNAIIASIGNVAYGNGKFVAISRWSNNASIKSSNGINWSIGGNIPTDGNGIGGEILFYHSQSDRFFAATANQNVAGQILYYTTDGTSWSIAAALPSVGKWSVTQNPNTGRLLAIKGGDLGVAYSDDAGDSWTYVGGVLPWTPTYDVETTMLRFHKDIFILPGGAYTSKYTYSFDGITWINKTGVPNIVWTISEFDKGIISTDQWGNAKLNFWQDKFNLTNSNKILGVVKGNPMVGGIGAPFHCNNNAPYALGYLGNLPNKLLLTYNGADWYRVEDDVTGGNYSFYNKMWYYTPEMCHCIMNYNSRLMLKWTDIVPQTRTVVY